MLIRFCKQSTAVPGRRHVRHVAIFARMIDGDQWGRNSCPCHVVTIVKVQQSSATDSDVPVVVHEDVFCSVPSEEADRRVGRAPFLLSDV